MLCRPDGVTGPVRWWRSMWRRAAAVDLLWLPVVAFDLAVTTVGMPCGCLRFGCDDGWGAGGAEEQRERSGMAGRT